MKISKHLWLAYANDLHIELDQAYDEGKDISGLEAEVKEIKAMAPEDPLREEKAIAFLDKIETLNDREGWGYTEPSDLASIHASRPEGRFHHSLPTGKEILFDKVYGAWLGRSAGCLLGQPVEGWLRPRLHGFLKDTGNYPVTSYMSSNTVPEIIEKYQIKNEGQVYGSPYINWINNVKHMIEDDDMNYTIIGLDIVRKYGCDFTPDDVSESWLMNLPVLHTCTAERIAYKNLLNLVPPPRSASYRNVYREWIGAQIRADFFGYVNPGNPEKAAEMAWRDASISHVKNGIYGEMWVAAMLAAAAATDDIETVIRAGLAEIPENSRLAEGVLRVLSWKKDSVGWEVAIDRIHHEFNEENPHHWCHTIPNAMIVTAGLLYGEADFEKSIGIAVTAAFDTDCNGATVGSIMGMIQGAKAMPGKWTEPLNDMIKSGVDGYGLVKISELAERTISLILTNPYVNEH
jgi:ADP-ribosylglycohydrolase